MFIKRNLDSPLRVISFIFRVDVLSWSRGVLVRLQSVAVQERPSNRHRKWNTTYMWQHDQIGPTDDALPKHMPSQEIIDSVLKEVRDKTKFKPPGGVRALQW